MNINSNDIITTDKYYDAFPKNYFKLDVIEKKSPIVWRGKYHSPPEKQEPFLITGHGDTCIDNNAVDYYSPQIWFTVNKQTTRTNVFSLPLGITNNTNESHLHPIYGNLDCMIQVMNELIEPNELVYMNFDTSTYPVERQYVWNLFSKKSWVKIGSIQNTIEGRINFLREIKSSSFVVCPRGNGLDTHRLWETLYMGSIPIVKRDIGYDDFSDLPICFVDNWEEVNPEFLEKEFIRIKNNSWNMEKLKIGYWIDKIKNQIK